MWPARNVKRLVFTTNPILTATIRQMGFEEAKSGFQSSARFTRFQSLSPLLSHTKLFKALMKVVRVLVLGWLLHLCPGLHLQIHSGLALAQSQWPVGCAPDCHCHRSCWSAGRLLPFAPCCRWTAGSLVQQVLSSTAPAPTGLHRYRSYFTIVPSVLVSIPSPGRGELVLFQPRRQFQLTLAHDLCRTMARSAQHISGFTVLLMLMQLQHRQAHL